jgi:uncharacterized protein
VTSPEQSPPVDRWNDWLLIVGGLFAAVAASAISGFVALQFVESRLGAALKPAEMRSHLGISLAGQLGLWVGLVGVTYFKARQHHESIIRWFRLSFSPFDVGWAFLGPVLQVVIGVAYSPFASAEEVSKTAKDIAARANGQVAAFIALSLAVSVGAPFVEELFFRGLVLRAAGGDSLSSGWSALRNRHNIVAIVISSLIFGVIHFNGLLTPGLVFFGVVAGCLAVVFRRLGPSVWLHIGFNASTMLSLAYQTWN